MNEEIEKYKEKREKIHDLLDDLKGEKPCPNCLKIIRTFIETMKFIDEIAEELTKK